MNKRGKWLILLSGIVLLLTGLVLTFAAEISTTKTYDPITKEATFTDISDKEIATAKLNTPSHVWIEAGKEKLIAEITISTKEEYDGFLKGIDFYNTDQENKLGLKRSITPTYKYLESISEKIVDVVVPVCSAMPQTACTYKNSTRIDRTKNWASFDILKPLPLGNITIGIFVDVAKGDFIEWIPTLFDTAVTEWATYGASVFDTHGQSMSGGEGATERYGLQIMPKYNISLDVVTAYDTSPSKCYVAYANDTLIVNGASLTNGNCSLTGIILKEHTAYKVFVDNGGSAFNNRYASSPSYPYVGTNINITGACGGGSTCTNTQTYINSIWMLTSRTYADSAVAVMTSLQAFPANNTAYVSGAYYNFTAVIADSNGTAGIEFNGVNYSALNSSTYFYINSTIKDLRKANFNYYFWAYSTSGDYNKTGTQNYFVANGTLAASLSGTTPITYGTAGNVDYTESNGGDGDVVYYFTRNNSVVAHPDTSTLAAGNYAYKINASGGANYTASTSLNTLTLTINKATGVVSLWLNNTQGNASIAEGDSIWLNASIGTGDSGSVTLYNNDTIICSNTTCQNLTTFSRQGAYNISAYYSGSENYTASWKTYNVSVTDTKIPQLTSPMSNLANGTTWWDSTTWIFYINISNTNKTAGFSIDGFNYSLTNTTGTWTSPAIGELLRDDFSNHAYYFWAYGSGTTTIYNQTPLSYYWVCGKSSIASGGGAVNMPVALAMGVATPPAEVKGLSAMWADAKDWFKRNTLTGIALAIAVISLSGYGASRKLKKRS